MRLGTVFVVICMVVIAASVGAMVHLAFDFGGSESAIIGLATLTVLSVYHYFSTRTGIPSVAPQQFADPARGDDDLARQVGELARRVTAVENRLDHAVDRARAVTDPIAFEIGELGALVGQLAETVSAQQATLTGLAEQGTPAAQGTLAEQGTLDERPVAPAGLPAEPFTGQSATEFTTPPNLPDTPRSTAPDIAAVEGAVARAPQATTLASIRSAIEAGHIELYLQPIVTLPQRKVPLLRGGVSAARRQGELLPPPTLSRTPKPTGRCRGSITWCFRCVQVVRRLVLKRPRRRRVLQRLGLDARRPAVSAVSRLPRREPRAGAVLVLEFRQGAVRPLGPTEIESLAASSTAASGSRSITSSICASSRASSPIAASVRHQGVPRHCCSTASGVRPTFILPIFPTWSAASAST